MKNILFAFSLLVCLLVFQHSPARAQYTCGTMEVIHNTLVEYFEEIPAALWKSNDNLSGVMYYNPESKAVSFVQLIRSPDGDVLVCVVSVGTLTNINLELLAK